LPSRSVHWLASNDPNGTSISFAYIAILTLHSAQTPHLEWLGTVRYRFI
jgi:hypothetical protein